MKKTMGMILALALLLVTTLALASGPYTCLLWNPIEQNVCLSWRPNLLPGAVYAAGSTTPDAGHMVLCTAPNFAGYCELVPLESVGNTSQYGWDNTTDPMTTNLKIASIKLPAGHRFTGFFFPSYVCPPFVPCPTWTGSVTDSSSYTIASFVAQ